jgi:hypothetical protein
MIATKWKIEPQKTRVIVQTVKGMVHGALALWLAQRFPLENILFASIDDQLVVARNRVMLDLGVHAPPSIEHFVLFDADMQPDHRIEPMFASEGDVVGCHYDTPTPNAWLRSDDVHCGALRFRREVLIAIQPPYFAFRYDPTGARCVACECDNFREKCVAAGLTIRREGYCRNLNQRSWCSR